MISTKSGLTGSNAANIAILAQGCDVVGIDKLSFF
jgi:hypothetical protein